VGLSVRALAWGGHSAAAQVPSRFRRRRKRVRASHSRLWTTSRDVPISTAISYVRAGRLRANGRSQCHAGTLRDDLTPGARWAAGRSGPERSLDKHARGLELALVAEHRLVMDEWLGLCRCHRHRDQDGRRRR